MNYSPAFNILVQGAKSAKPGEEKEADNALRVWVGFNIKAGSVVCLRLKSWMVC